MGSTWSRWRQERHEQEFMSDIRRLRKRREAELRRDDRRHAELRRHAARSRNHEPSLEDHLRELQEMRDELERIRPTIISNPSEEDRIRVLRDEVATLRSLYEDRPRVRPEEINTQPRVVHTGDADVDLVINQEIQNMSRSEIAANFEARSNIESSDSGSGSSSNSDSNLDPISMPLDPGPRLPPNDNDGAALDESSHAGQQVNPEVNSESTLSDQHVVNVDTDTLIPASAAPVAQTSCGKSQVPENDKPQKYCLICIDAPSSGNALISCWRCTASWCFKHYAKMERKECPQCRASLLTLSTSSGGIDSVDVVNTTRSNNVSSSSRPNIVDNIMSSGRSTTTSTNVHRQTLADLVLQSNNRTMTVNGHRLRRPGESRTATTSGFRFDRNGNLVVGNDRNEQMTINRGGGVTIVRTRAFAFDS